jgi:hypothetical protein
MIEVYRALAKQARSWGRTWERVPSRVRGPGYGNSYGKGVGTGRSDLTLAAPPLPQGPGLKVQPVIAEKYAAFVSEARSRMLENDQLILAIQDNFARAERNRYNLEVLLALAKFAGHHWRLLAGLEAAEGSLGRAEAAAEKKNPRQAVGQMVAAHNAIERLEKEGVENFRALEAVYEKSRFPKGQSVGGRKFVHVFDDTKDHWADRTPDLGFMFAPERSIGLGQWRKELYKTIQAYAKEHNVPVRGLAEARLEE